MRPCCVAWLAPTVAFVRGAYPKAGIVLAFVAILASGCAPSPDGTTDQVGPERASIQGMLEGRRGVPPGPCVWIHTVDGRDIEVAWPDRWSYDDDPPVVMDAAGAVVASAGDTLEIEGTWAQAGASVCDMGRQLDATTITVVKDP